MTERPRTSRRPARPAIALGIATLLAPSPGRAWSARTNYALHCQGCHLADGRETPGLVPGLRGTVGVLASTPEGRDYLVRLPNVAAAPIEDAELAALLDWVVLAFGDGSVPAAPFGAREVSARRRPLVDVESAREAVLGPRADR